MSVGAQVGDDLSSATRDLPATWERRLRELRLDGLAPTAGRGGGKRSAHYESDDLSHALFAAADPLPSGGPAAARMLDALPYIGPDPETLPEGMKPSGRHLGTMVASMLEDLGRRLSEGQELSPASLAYVRTWELVLCLNPPSAQIMVGEEENQITYYFAADPTPEPAPGLRRLTILSGDVWLAAGILLADTYIQHNAIKAVQFLARTKPAMGSQENENAGDLFHKVPAPSNEQHRANDAEFGNQPASNGSGRSPEHPEGILEGENTQGRSQGEMVTSDTQ